MQVHKLSVVVLFVVVGEVLSKQKNRDKGTTEQPLNIYQDEEFPFPSKPVRSRSENEIAAEKNKQFWYHKAASAIQDRLARKINQNHLPTRQGIYYTGSLFAKLLSIRLFNIVD
ncbi:unnamed protein product [Diabrotica balteata]|uniref:Uncharacterized protein n=1 Tax=Diabrotica balteata TaxID=107213 RepID=A0A9N9X6R3_DIABA|nr:unnamed protein product [Diabrotica balteata]